MKKLMAQEESMVPNLFFNLKRALMPLMHDDTYAAMASVTAGVEAANFNPRNRVSGAGSAAGGGASALASTGDRDGVSQNSRVAKRSLPPAHASSSTEDSNEEICKRPKGTNASEEAPISETATGVEEEEEDDGDVEEPIGDNNNQSCSTSGGYCPPCYELA